MNTKRTILIILVFTFFGCSKNKSVIELNTLPAATQTGANTLGFKIDSRIWTTNGIYCYNQFGNCRENPSATFYRFRNGELWLTSDRIISGGSSITSSENFTFSIYKDFTGTGIYRLSGVDSLYDASYSNNTTSQYYHLLPNRETFEVNITKFDTVAKIVSGNFSGKLFNVYVPNDSMNISDGRFDIKLK